MNGSDLSVSGNRGGLLLPKSDDAALCISFRLRMIASLFPFSFLTPHNLISTPSIGAGYGQIIMVDFFVLLDIRMIMYKRRELFQQAQRG